MVGIVAEFDPFHNGHGYLIDTAKAVTGQETAVVVMSGSFVQRGAPAVMSKEARVACALLGGVDVVLELPLTFALAPAERFAHGAVALLTATGTVTHLAFGSECGDVDAIRRVAAFLCEKGTVTRIRERMKTGLSFAAARQQVTEEALGETSSLLRTPNDILAVEYVKALIRQNSPLCPVAIRRKGVAHDGLAAEDGMASASLVRCLMKEGGDPSKYLPSAVYQRVCKEREDGNLRFSRDDLFLSALRRMTKEELRRLPEVREGMENRLYRACREQTTLEGYAEALSCSRYTKATAKRVACYALLGITKQDLELTPSYLRILGAGDRGTACLRGIKQTAKLPLITKPAHGGDRLFWENRAADMAGLFANRIQLAGGEYKNTPIFTKYLTESKKRT